MTDTTLAYPQDAETTATNPDVPDVWISPEEAFVYLSQTLPPLEFTPSRMTFYSWIKKGGFPGAVQVGEGRGARIKLPLAAVLTFDKSRVPRKRSGRPIEPDAPYSKHKHRTGLDIA